MESLQHGASNLSIKNLNSKSNDQMQSDVIAKETIPSNIFIYLQAPETVSAGYLLHKTKQFIYVIKPPDGGYAWIILFAAFFNGVISEGNIMSIGTILPSIEKDLLVKKYTTAFIASIQTSTYYCVGIITSAFINKVGFRTVAFFGLTASVLGLLIGSFCRDSICLTMFFGFFFGSGVGMLAMVSQLIVAYYFEKYRAVAVGLQSASIGIGLLLYGSLNSYLIKIFNWSINLRIMALSFLLCYLFSAAFKRVQLTKVKLTSQCDKSLDSESVGSVELRGIIYSSFPQEDIKNEIAIDALPQNSQTKGWKQLENFFQTNLTEENEISSKKNSDIENKTAVEISSSKLDVTKSTLFISERKQEVKDLSPENFKESEDDHEKCCTINKKIIWALKILFDIQLLESVKFEIIQIASCFLIMAHIIPFLYAIERTRIPSTYSNWLLSFVGIVNIILRILLGIMAQYTREYTSYLCGGCIIFGGIGILISCFTTRDKIWIEFFYCGIFTFSSAAFFSLRSIVIINAIGIKKLINAFGLIYLGAGIFSFIGINIAGTLVTYFNSMEPAFIMSTCLLIISGILFILIPIISIKRKSEA